MKKKRQLNFYVFCTKNTTHTENIDCLKMMVVKYLEVVWGVVWLQLVSQDKKTEVIYVYCIYIYIPDEDSQLM